MSVAVIIPVRLNSTRLPNKPLADIAGKPMIQHVWERGMSANIGPVVVACCDPEVEKVVQDFGGNAIMTDPDLPSGSDRVRAALYHMDKDVQTVICLQGDLPTIEPELIRKSLTPLDNPDVDIATLVSPIKDSQQIHNPNVVKVALSLNKNKQTARAIYFSRTAIPAQAHTYFYHIGLYAYRREALERFITLPPGVLEQQEKLEQLRALENGMRIDAQVVSTSPLGVDTPEDLEMARRLLD